MRRATISRSANKVSQDCWEILYLPSLGIPRLGNEEFEISKENAEHSMLGVRRLMVKCSSLERRQRKAYKSKVELPETQVPTDLSQSVTHEH